MANYTELYCTPSGRNIYAGSSAGDPSFVFMSGHWRNGANTFTLVNGDMTLSGVVGQLFSLFNIEQFPTGIARFIGRIDSITPTGLASHPTVRTSLLPPSGWYGISIGGSWYGPSGNTNYPFHGFGTAGAALSQLALLPNINQNPIRLNMQSDRLYCPTGVIVQSVNANGIQVEGYRNTPGDGGKAYFTVTPPLAGAQGAASIFVNTQANCNFAFVNIVFSGNRGNQTHSLPLVLNNSTNLAFFEKCIFVQGRGFGLQTNSAFTSQVSARRCIFVDNNLSNTTGLGGAGHGKYFNCVFINNRQVGQIGGIMLTNNISIFNSGSGFEQPVYMFQNASIRNGANGIVLSTVPYDILIQNCHIERNLSWGITHGTINVTQKPRVLVDNCSFALNSFGILGGTLDIYDSGVIHNLETSAYGPNFLTTPWEDYVVQDTRLFNNDRYMNSPTRPPFIVGEYDIGHIQRASEGPQPGQSRYNGGYN